MALNQWAQKSLLAKFAYSIGILFRKRALLEASPRLYSLTSQSANPALSHKTNGSGVD